jgi:translation initiation factor IF-2
MSKKDLLERLTRAPSDPARPVRREDEPGLPRTGPPEPGVQTRLGTRVVRRRKADGPEETGPAPTVVRRRAVSIDEPPPIRRAGDDAGRAAPRQDAEPPRRAEPAPERVEVEAAPAPVEAPRPEPVAAQPEPPVAQAPVAQPPSEARTGEARTGEQRQVDASPAPSEPRAAEPRAAQPQATEPRAAEPRTAEPATEPRAAQPQATEPRAVPRPAERPTEAPRSVAADGRPTAPRADTRPPEARPSDARPAEARPGARPDGRAPISRPGQPSADGSAAPAGPPGPGEPPRFSGLGKAVVMPPPGYDPTNPQAFRRRQEAERQDRRAATPPPAARRRPDGPGHPPAFGADPRSPQPPGPPGGDAGRRRRGPAESARVFERPNRLKRRKVGGQKAASPGPKAQKRKIKVDNVISVGQLAHELGVKAPVVIRQLMDLGVMASVNQMLDLDTASLVAAEFEYEVENVGFQEQNYLESVAEQVEGEAMQGRPPVVTIMGHVDHGKTTLLDSIRKARVAQGEAGGITQHIGAYQVSSASGPVTFIDTPGHEAFSAMRARGASVTDIVVLVVAADDGVQPQTVEAIQHAKAAGVPIVVAVNKMDKAGVSMDPIMTRLSEHGLTPEQWGGETMYCGVSALKGEGIDSLLETILLQSEVLDLQANPDRFAEGIVLEAKMERGRGAVATVLVQKGTLHRGDHVVLGSAFGKVRAIVDHTGAQLKDAPPSTPVELFGLSELPEVGDSVHAVKSEQNARALAEHRAQARRDQAMAATRKKTAADLFEQASSEDRVRFHIILKADVGGSLQALKTAIEKIEVGGAECRILLAGVGDLTESDVNLAASNDAHLLAFNVKLDAKARQAASQLGVEAEFYSVIYDLLDRVQRGMKGLLAPVIERVRMGTVEVRQLFRISKVGVVAGSYVQDGKVSRNNLAKVLRDGNVVYEGKVTGLKRFKEDVREVTAGFECGVSLDGFEELQAGDIIETWAEQRVEQA